MKLLQGKRFTRTIVSFVTIAGLSVFALSGCVFSDTITQRVYDNEETSEVDTTVAPKLINNINATTENDALPQLANDPNGSSTSETSKQIPVYVEDASKAVTEEKAARPIYSASAQYAGQASVRAANKPETDTEQTSGDTDKQKSKDGTKKKSSNKGKTSKKTTKKSTKKTKSGNEKNNKGKQSGKVSGGKGDGTGATYTGDENETPEIPSNIDEVAAVGNNAVIVSMLAGTEKNTVLKAVDKDTQEQTEELLAKKGISKSFAAWDNDGTSSGDLSDANFKKLTTEKNIPDLIFVTEGDDTLSAAQIKSLKKSKVDIYTLPQLTSSKRIRFAVEVIGKILDKGGVDGAGKKYQEYLDFESAMVSKYQGKNGGVTGGYDFSAGKKTSEADKLTVSLFVDNWDKSARVSASYIDSSSGVATATLGFESSPISYYLSNGGVLNNAASQVFRKAMDGDSGIVWQFRSNDSSYSLDSWKGLDSASYDLQGLSSSNIFASNLLCYSKINSDGSYVGLGSSKDSIEFPGVIAKTQQIQKLFTSQSKKSGQLYYAYSAEEADDSSAIGLAHGNEVLDSCIGNNGADTPSGEDYEVYVNPKGLVQSSADDKLCSWTDGSVESVLETSWAYWVFQGGEKSDFEDDVKEFYSTFYGYSLNSSDLSEIEDGVEK